VSIKHRRKTAAVLGNDEIRSFSRIVGHLTLSKCYERGDWLIEADINQVQYLQAVGSSFEMDIALLHMEQL
jgi:hypothetical protein